MIAILAQIATPEAAELGGWLLCLFSILGALNQGARFINYFRPHPPASEVYATKDELHKVEARVQLLGEEIKANYNKIMTSSADARRRLYDKMDDIAAVVHRLEGQNEK
ncbi:MAG: hypothetical protein PHQ12_04700 [Chthoniobacteraceae bacterium]|nr:hypothetical protein [Chthoniobacteraceae bacterium]